jgi:hypothetical protein
MDSRVIWLWDTNYFSSSIPEVPLHRKDVPFLSEQDSAVPVYRLGRLTGMKSSQDGHTDPDPDPFFSMKIVLNQNRKIN